MIRDEVLFWGAAVLLLFFAFVLMPVHERFKDAQGRETDVSPDAPPKPDWLKAVDERTGKIEGFWGSLTSFFTPSREKMTDVPLSGITAQQSSTPPQFTTDSTLGSTTGTTGMERTLTQGDLQESQIRFIQTLIGNEADQATKLGLAEGLATLQELARSTSTSANNIPLGSADKRVYESLTGVPSSYAYKQFEYAYRIAGGVNASSSNIVKMLQSIPSNFNPTATPRRTVSTISQMSQMDAVTPPDLYGPGPNVLRSALQSCTCASQTSGCPKHG
jgi:hypothetical protein